jgi:hypothetical protein
MPDYLQRIGVALQEMCPPASKKSLLYAEIEEGVIGASVFFEDATGNVNFRFASTELESVAYDLWDIGSEKIPARSWTAVEYTLTGNKLGVSFTYSEQFQANESEIERRPRVVERHFPGAAVDFSKPNG